MPLPQFQPTFLPAPAQTPPSRLGPLPAPQTSSLGGLFSGVAEGFVAGRQMALNAKKQETQEKLQKIEAFGAAMKSFGSPNAGADIVLKKWLEFGGATPEEIKEFQNLHKQAVQSKNRQDLTVIRRTFGRIGAETGYDPRVFLGLYRENPTAFFKVAENVRNEGRQAQVSEVTSRLGETSTPEQVRGALAQRGLLDEAGKVTTAFKLRSAETPIPAFLDDTGRVKPAVSSRIQRMVAEGLGGRLDEAGRVLGLPSSLAEKLPNLTAEAERRLASGESNALGDAVTKTLANADIPENVTLTKIADRIVDITEKSGVEGEGDGVRLLQTQDATGIASGVKDFILNQVIGQIFPDAVDQDVVNARQQLGLLANDFIVAEKRSPRLPVWEQMRLSRIFTEPSVWRSPEQVRLQLKSFDKRLTDTILQEKEFLKAPVSDERKQEALNNIREAARFRRRVRKFNLKPFKGALKKAPKSTDTIDFRDLPQ